MKSDSGWWRFWGFGEVGGGVVLMEQMTEDVSRGRWYLTPERWRVTPVHHWRRGTPIVFITSLRKIQQDWSLFSISSNLGLKWLKNTINSVYLRRITRWIFLHQIKWHLVRWSHIFFTLHFVAAFYTCSVSILYLWIRSSFALWKAE